VEITDRVWREVSPDEEEATEVKIVTDEFTEADDLPISLED